LLFLETQSRKRFLVFLPGMAALALLSGLVHMVADPLVPPGTRLDAWMEESEYTPDTAPAVWSDSTKEQLQLLSSSFHSYLCKLPVSNRSFGVAGRGGDAVPRDAPLFTHVTAAKLYLWWPNNVFETLICYNPPSMVNLLSLDGWLFMPSPQSGRCAETRAWQPLDMRSHCSTSDHDSDAGSDADSDAVSDADSDDADAGADSATALASRPKTPTAEQLGGASAATWMKGQLTHLALNSLGACARNARDSFLNARGSHPAQLLVEGGQTIGMHVRRGDSCERWEWEPGKGRVCYALSTYMDAARRLRARYGASHIHLATDSPSVIQEAAQYTPEFTFEFLQMNRTGVGGKEGKDQPFIERRTSEMTAGQKADVIGTLMADIAFLSEADMLVGTADATMTHLTLWSQIGRLNGVPPFVLLGGTVKSSGMAGMKRNVGYLSCA
jgi:hypothetical protein